MLLSIVAYYCKMLTLLKISRLALIDELRLEFASGLNLLTGETGSGKSIIVDALGLLIGGRSSADLIKQGARQGYVEGEFSVNHNPQLASLLDAASIEWEANGVLEVRRELSATGRNRVFVNGQMVTQGFLRGIGPLLADIHGQGDQQTLFNPDAHLDLFDVYAQTVLQRERVAELHRAWQSVARDLRELRENEDKKLQMLDLLRFQVEELTAANLTAGEDQELEEERKRLNNVEKLSALSASLIGTLYEADAAIIPQLGAALRQIAELAEFDSHFSDYSEGLANAQAVLEDVAFAVRDFGARLEFSPSRLAEVEDRLMELSRLKRKYGGSLENALAHLAASQEKLGFIEDSDARAALLEREVAAAQAVYLQAAQALHDVRMGAKDGFESQMERQLAALAMEKARFVVNLTTPDNETRNGPDALKHCTARGFDRVEFYFSANPGEPPRPLARTASGGEASRLMLVLKTLARPTDGGRTAVFDEVDTGIGGRVAEAVGLRLQGLARTEQVLCVTHQPQVAALADAHYRVIKETDGEKTTVHVVRLSYDERVEELARMLTGAHITDTARRHAAEMLAARDGTEG